jgi:hypothetical protein
MNVFKFSGTDGRYLVAIPYRNKWLTIEEGSADGVIEYLYVPGLKRRVSIHTTERGIRYVYGDWRKYLRNCTFKYPPSWAVMGRTL